MAIRVPVDVEFDPGGLGDGHGVVYEDAVFGGVTGGLAAVGFVAGVGGGAAGDVPLVWPVAVDISTNARLAGAALAVLSPEAVVGGCVDEA